MKKLLLALLLLPVSTATVAQEISEEQEEHYREVLEDPDFDTIFMKAKVHYVNDVMMLCITLPEQDGGALGNCFSMRNISEGIRLLQEAREWARENDPALLITPDDSAQGA